MGGDAKMTDEEWKAWEIQRAGQMNPAPKPSLEARLGWLEADASAQRTAILKLERDIKLIALAGLAVLVPTIVLEMLT
jgi:hypothetical protein